MEASGDEIILGFDDGNLRSVILTIPNNASPSLSLYQVNNSNKTEKYTVWFRIYSDTTIDKNFPNSISSFGVESC